MLTHWPHLISGKCLLHREAVLFIYCRKLETGDRPPHFLGQKRLRKNVPKKRAEKTARKNEKLGKVKKS